VENPYRPRAQNQDHVVKPHPRAPLAVDAAGERLGQRQLLGGQVFPRHEQTARLDGVGGDLHILAQAPLDLVAHGPEVLADVLLVALAIEAPQARYPRVHGHRSAHLKTSDVPAHLGDVAGQLVAEDGGGMYAGGLLPAQDAQVGAAHRVGPHLHQNLVRPDGGCLDLGDLQLSGAAKNGGYHRYLLSV
jgi:hypothetical protein